MQGLRLIHKMWDFCAQILFPRFCFGCGGSGSYICTACASQCTPQTYRLDAGMQVYACIPYQNDGIKRALKQLKYRGSRDIASALAELLADALKKNPRDTEIVAIPTTAARRHERGFNQAELLGRALAAQLNLPFADALVKIRETPPQSTLKRNERLKNLRGAFAARGDHIPQKTVIIVDDISTTGATLIEAARALKKSGAQTVIGAVVAHS